MTLNKLPFVFMLAINFFYLPLHAQQKVLKKDTASQSIGVKYDLTFFKKGQSSPWQFVSTEYIRKTKKLALIARVNFAHRYGMNAGQLEADAYPVISKKIYAYLNMGYAPAKRLFPQYRTGASLFFSLPAKFEAEAGARYLYFNSPVYIYTASVGKYYKKYWFNFSTFLSPQNSNISSSFFLKSRYYINETDFVMLLLGTGLSPDNSVDNTLLNTYLTSKKAELSLKRSINKSLILLLSSSLSRQQIQQDAYINQYNISIGLQAKL